MSNNCDDFCYNVAFYLWKLRRLLKSPQWPNSLLSVNGIVSPAERLVPSSSNTLMMMGLYTCLFIQSMHSAGVYRLTRLSVLIFNMQTRKEQDFKSKNENHVFPVLCQRQIMFRAFLTHLMRPIFLNSHLFDLPFNTVERLMWMIWQETDKIKIH